MTYNILTFKSYVYTKLVYLNTTKIVYARETTKFHQYLLLSILESTNTWIY